MEDYTRASLSMADRVVANGEPGTGSLPRSSLPATARERQGTRFTQAIVLYEALLDTNPPPEISTRVLSRIEGIHTMSIEPRAAPGRQRIANPTTTTGLLRGGMQQYYLNAVIDRPGRKCRNRSIEVFVTDVNLHVQRRTDA